MEVVDERERNSAKSTFRKLPPLAVKWSYYTHISSFDAFGGRNVRTHGERKMCIRITLVYTII